MRGNQFYIINVKKLEKTNNLTIMRFLNETFKLLFLSNQVFYPNLYLAHALNGVNEAIRLEFPWVVNIATGKSFFLIPIKGSSI